MIPKNLGFKISTEGREVTLSLDAAGACINLVNAGDVILWLDTLGVAHKVDSIEALAVLE